MFKDDLQYIYENVIVETYNKDFYEKQIKRFSSQAGRYVTSDQIRAKIKRFGTLKNTWRSAKELEKRTRKAIEQGQLPENERRGAVILPVNAKDKARIAELARMPLEIRNYNWKDLEAIVDQFPDPEEKAALEKDVQAGGGVGKVVYNENNLTVTLGRDANECFIIKRKVQQEREIKDVMTYPWCVSRDPTGSSNLFTHYRFGTPNMSAYFVHDKDKSVNDPWHFFVVHVTQTPVQSRHFGNANTIYMVTDAKNEGDVYMPWEQIEKIQPKLKGQKDLFQFVPLTEDEQIQQVLLRGANADTFKTYASYKVKRAYIKASSKNKIYKEDYLELDPVLQHLYINMRAPNAGDTNIFDKLQRLMLTFADSKSKEELSDLIAKGQEFGRRTQKETGRINPGWMDIVADNPTVKKSKQNQTVKRYKELIVDCLSGISRELKALKATGVVK